MPRYYFNLRSPDDVQHDTDGVVLTDHDAAQAYARRIIRELKEDGGYDDPELMIDVQDQTGQIVHSISF